MGRVILEQENVPLNFCDAFACQNPNSTVFLGRQKTLENQVNKNRKQTLPIQVLFYVNII